jgi:hypothetical protein
MGEIGRREIAEMIKVGEATRALLWWPLGALQLWVATLLFLNKMRQMSPLTSDSIGRREIAEMIKVGEATRALLWWPLGALQLWVATLLFLNKMRQMSPLTSDSLLS